MDHLLADIIAADLKVLFCGINPGLKSAIDGHHFSGRSNRFWRALHLSGFTPHEIAAIDDSSILRYGYGLTTVVERPTTRADELAKHEFADSAVAFTRKIEQYRPRYVAFLGKPAFQALSGLKTIAWGAQDMKFGGARVWVLPNPSGLNRGFSLSDLVGYYNELYQVISVN
ncbi:G/U mismatch-specific DNA glycosylase [Chitinophaga agrisoli]|uniref:G/U mismatch-specific DNA glycosylase n=1 Tax=Chitinophaga agrisoli TaxID=2607653 RepID=A0A5B2VVV9_9BACT|nr:G/U mismatch-specific DNA glycosylase [Chitinophaga agrisoli]KAA2242718.1 G/U mismatch-specific DNA glycosylase [Chitinophaga agrisoli]